MRPTTSAVQDFSSNILHEKDLSEEDSKYLLKALEKQAFEHVLYAFRAQGPLTKYKELILDHLKSALFISDQEFSLNLRIAANNPYLNEIVQKLNPSYDNFSEWLAAGLDLTGAEMANSRKQNNTNSRLIDHSNQILREIRRHNKNLCRENSVTSEAIAELYHLPKRPFMPEKLRKLLRDTEADGFIDDIETKNKIDNINTEVIPQTNSTISPSKQDETQQNIKKRNVGRPRKYPRKEEPSYEQHKTQQKTQQALVETVKNNNNIGNNFKLFTGKTWGNRKPNRWQDSTNVKEDEEQPQISMFALSRLEDNEPLKSVWNNEKQKQQFNLFKPSTSRSSTEAMENLADLALAQIGEFPLITSSSSTSSPINTLQSSSITTSQVYINHHKTSTNESIQQQQTNLLNNNKIIQNDSNNSDNKNTSFNQLANYCAARVRPFVFDQQSCGNVENRSNFRSSSSPLPLHVSSSQFNKQNDLIKTNTNSLTTFISSSNNSFVLSKNNNNKKIINSNNNDDDHTYEKNNFIQNKNKIIPIEYFNNKNKEDDDDLIILNNPKEKQQQQQQNGFNFDDDDDIIEVMNNNSIPAAVTPSSSTLINKRIIHTVPVINEEESGLDFLASTASLLQPIEMYNNKNNNERSCSSNIIIGNGGSSNNNKQGFIENNKNKRHSTFTK